MGLESGLAFAVALALVGGAWYVVERARQHHVPPRVLTAISLACLVTLVLVALSDWPSEWLNEFWADHSIIAALLSTVLIVGAGLLGFEARSLHEQERLSEAMAGTAFAGLVNPVTDVDTALWLITSPGDLPADWQQPEKPLRWVRHLHDGGAGQNGRDANLDTQTWTTTTEAEQLIDQAIRRVVGGARDWAALASSSVDGRAALAALGRIRNDLTDLSATLGRDTTAEQLVAELVRLRADVQQTAMALERASMVHHARATVRAYPTGDVRAQEPDKARRIEAMLGDLAAVSARAGNMSSATRVYLRDLLPAEPPNTGGGFWHR